MKIDLRVFLISLFLMPGCIRQYKAETDAALDASQASVLALYATFSGPIDELAVNGSRAVLNNLVDSVGGLKEDKLLRDQARDVLKLFEMQVADRRQRGAWSDQFIVLNSKNFVSAIQSAKRIQRVIQ